MHFGSAVLSSALETDFKIRGQCNDHAFGYFCRFSAKKIGVFLKNQCYYSILQNLAMIFNQNRHYFRQFFCRKYFENHNIGRLVFLTLHLIKSALSSSQPEIRVYNLKSILDPHPNAKIYHQK
jgi:hypothetical protein